MLSVIIWRQYLIRLVGSVFFGGGWRRGVVVSGVRRMKGVNARRARLVPRWVTTWAGILSRYATSQLGQLSLASLRDRLIEYQLRLG